MVNMRPFDDIDEQKKWIDDAILSAFTNKTYKGRNTFLTISNPEIEKKEYTIADQKAALLANRNLSRAVKGDVKLYDSKTNELLGEKRLTLAQAPYITGRNTVISNGTSFGSPANQLRLRPGAYTRKKENGEIETHFNLVSGSGSGFRINMDPETGIFNLNLKTVNAPLYPFLKEMGISDDKLKDTWGDKILEINKNRGGNIVKFYKNLVPFGNPNISEEEKRKAILGVFTKAKMDKEVNEITLKKPIENVTPEALLLSTDKIIKINTGKEIPDDRDSLLFKKVYTAEDFYKEKITKDAGSLGKKLMIRMDRHRTLDKMNPGFFTRQLWGVIKSDPSVSPVGTLAQPLEEINPIDLYDQHHKVTLLGEGGIGDIHTVTMDARNVHPSEFGFIDPIRTPESGNVGIDKRIAMGVKKGDDNLLYREFTNTKTNKPEWLNPLQVSAKTVAFAGEWDSDKKELDSIKGGKINQVPRKDVDYYLKYPYQQFSLYDNLVPLPQTIQGNRMIMAGKALALTMPLKEGDAPLVQTLKPDEGISIEKFVADKVVNKLAKVNGTIVKIDQDNLWIKDEESGEKIRHGLYHDFPLNLKTSITHKLLVKEGDKVKKGDLLANSNYSDKQGTLAIGKNLKTVYMPFKGWNFEDGIILSETGAKKLASEQMYTYEYNIDDPGNKFVGKAKYSGMFPTIYNKDIMEKIDSTGVIKKGTIIKPGEPLILAMEKRLPSSRDIQLGNLHKNLRQLMTDQAVSWDHHSDGEVADTFVSDKTVKVLVKTTTPATVGDKLTGRFGNKGVISSILPDSQMPKLKDTGEPMEMILNPISIPSRINMGQMHEAALGKIAHKTGKPYIIPGMASTNVPSIVEGELKKFNISPDDDIEYEGRTIPKVFNGYSYVWKLAKMSEGELRKREIGGYDLDQQPVKGKDEQGQAIRLGNMEINALIGHGAKENLREMSTIKGQRNDDFWRAFKLGYTIPSPNVPFVYDKFLTMLKGSGINVKKEGTQQFLMPLTDKNMMEWSSGKVTKPDILYTKNLQPIKGGLFDIGVTGGTIGRKWSHINLVEPVPNPVMEDPIKKILRINDKEFTQKLRLNTMEKSLKDLDLDTEIKKSEELINKVSGQKRDQEVKRLSYMQTLKKNGLNLNDLVWHNVPVIPPVYRPVSVVGTSEKIQPGNANLLYKDLIVTNSLLETNKQELPDSELGSERVLNYKAVKSVVGLGDPVNVMNQKKQVGGFIAQIVGDQPKTGYFQKKVFNKTQDIVSRGVASPDPTLSMDQLGIPEEAAWKDYKPFVMRRMIQMGSSAVEAEKDIENKTQKARAYLEAEMRDRPVIMNRNPTLHKFNTMAFKPVLVEGNTIKASPPIVTGFNLDFDGDQINLFLPVTPEAVREAKEKLMPSKNLYSIKTRNVHYLPSQGSVLGLYAMTQPPESKKIVKKYNSVDELRAEFSKGLVKATDLVEIGK